ncbi:arsenate reductase ArsC [Alisedimentitalea sp. MJ-SS2]|uniref:arsenate reductase ArsC n=1 Tax=Aliisedimentitalea sp. MJ-SS2 TaxID=3049795 RepID=UPI00290C4EEF|nr:arsenate reductase ArsC [Alisedimentitalea sp. MJ-SS2]MDU8926949.1 arsenate reductase ArsC [Alisedimentitalea sp. MJ-SS2]
MKILVLCTGNSARSILLEALLNRLEKGRITAFSAGSNPTGAVHPQSLKLLGGKGYDLSGARSKSWDEFAAPGAPELDIVITVCASAAGEVCPIWPSTTPGKPLRAHWGVDDPAVADETDWQDAFQTAYDILDRRAQALLDLPLEDMKADAMKTALDRIGTLP